MRIEEEIHINPPEPDIWDPDTLDPCELCDTSINNLKYINRAVHRKTLRRMYVMNIKDKKDYKKVDTAPSGRFFSDFLSEDEDLIITFLLKENGFKDSFHITHDTAYLFIGERGDMFELKAIPVRDLPLLDSLKRIVDSIPKGKYRVSSERRIDFKIKYGDKTITCYGRNMNTRDYGTPLIIKSMRVIAKAFQRYYRRKKGDLDTLG